MFVLKKKDGKTKCDLSRVAYAGVVRLMGGKWFNGIQAKSCVCQ